MIVYILHARFMKKKIIGLIGLLVIWMWCNCIIVCGDTDNGEKECPPPLSVSPQTIYISLLTGNSLLNKFCMIVCEDTDNENKYNTPVSVVCVPTDNYLSVPVGTQYQPNFH